MAAPPLRPGAGFVLQAESSGSPPGRWFLNMCKHRLVELPISYAGKPISKEYILSHGIGSMQVPFDMGSFRKLKARAEGAKQTTYAIDVVFNPLIVQLFMDDSFCKTMDQFRPYVINLALRRIEESVGVKLALPSVKLVKEFRYKDPEDEDGTVREFTELPGTMESFEEEAPRPAPSKPKEEELGPLIEDVTPQVNKKPAIKKGFLNKAGGSLYGDEGSKEGVVPENAGDPLGYLPKKLRQNCKIVDTNAPEYQEAERKKKAAESTNAMGQEFRDTLSKDMESWCKKMQPDKWEEDRPDGPEPLQTGKKYDVNYSRFDTINDVEEAEVIPQRDWYYDDKGQRHQIGQEAKLVPREEAKESSGQTIKKGFLDQAKTPLYPKGSEQAKAPLSESEMQAQFLKEFGILKEGEENQPPALQKGGAKSSTAVKKPETKAPEFSLEEVVDGDKKLLRLTIEVPGLESMEGVDLDVTDCRASVAFPAQAGLRAIQVELPKHVQPTAVWAKFSRKTRQITASMPIAGC